MSYMQTYGTFPVKIYFSNRVLSVCLTLIANGIWQRFFLRNNLLETKCLFLYGYPVKIVRQYDELYRKYNNNENMCFICQKIQH